MPARDETTALLELAARCEAAAGLDRELDAAICVALGIEPQAREMLQFPAYDSCVRYFTASLDAAMGLVPEGWFPWVGKDKGYDPEQWSATIDGPSRDQHVEGYGSPTPALALTAAALRARASS